MAYDRDLFDALEAAEDKLEDLIKKNRWSMQIEKSTYPIMFRFRKGIDSFAEEWDKNTTPQVEFIFRSNIELVSYVPENRRVDEKFFNKLKNLCKEVHRLYLLAWFSRKESRYEQCVKEVRTTSDGRKVCLVSPHYEP